jgi:hypothetical protein
MAAREGERGEILGADLLGFAGGILMLYACPAKSARSKVHLVAQERRICR